MPFIAALPMYDWPEVRQGVDARWAALRARLLAAGVAAPRDLVRRNADMPPVPGGIRAADGALLAPDPAMLPPDDLDLDVLWRHPRLLLGETCRGPMSLGLSAHVAVVGQNAYDGIPGGGGVEYRSAVVARRDVGRPAAVPATRGLCCRWPTSKGGSLPSMPGIRFRDICPCAMTLPRRDVA